jgi:DNA-directed RNA polymerase specialized sigma subunit
MTETTLRVAHPADSVAAERLWDALYQARAARSRRLVADLEDAAFRRYLPLARTLAHTAAGNAKDADRTAIEQAAELGLANAVLAWRQSTSAGFRRFARSSIIRELSRR